MVAIPRFLASSHRAYPSMIRPVLRHKNRILESTISQAIERINFASRHGKLVLNATGMRAELIYMTGYKLARGVIQFSSRLTPPLFFSLQGVPYQR